MPPSWTEGATAHGRAAERLRSDRGDPGGRGPAPQVRQLTREARSADG